MLGQAAGRNAIPPETTAKNVMNASIPDDAGYKPENRVIVENGPAELHSTFNAVRIVEAVNEVGVPCVLSMCLS